MRKRAIRRSTLLAGLALLLCAGQAKAITIDWTGPSDGDSPDMTILFPGFAASTLTSISGGGYWHNHGNTSVVFTLDLNIDSVWTTIDSWTSDAADHLLSERMSGGPIAFSGGIITGLRLTDTPFVGNGFHAMYGSYLAEGTTAFTFDGGNAVPEPASLTLVGLGLAGILLRRRMKRE